MKGKYSPLSSEKMESYLGSEHKQPTEASCKLPFKSLFFFSFARLNRRQKGLKLLWKSV